MARARRARRLTHIMAILGVICSFAIAAPRAGADTGCPTSDGQTHCYGIGEYGPIAGGNPTYVTAEGSNLEVNCLSVPNPQTDFVDWELWLLTNTNNPNLLGKTWVEEGMTDGSLQGGVSGFLWFWAEDLPPGGQANYHEHEIGNAQTNVAVNAAFYYAGGTSWNVYKGGTYVGESVNNGAYAGSGENGVEISVGNGTLSGSSASWGFYDLNNNWHLVSGEPYYNNSLGLITGSASGQHVYGHIHTCTGAAPAANRAAQSSGQSPDSLVTTAAAWLDGLLGGTAPQSVTYVSTTRGAAVKLDSGAAVNSDQAAYLVQMTGTFTVPKSVLGPSSSGSQAAAYASLVVDASTGQVLDWGTTPMPDNLASLGTPQPVSPSAIVPPAGN